MLHFTIKNVLGKINPRTKNLKISWYHLDSQKIQKSRDRHPDGLLMNLLPLKRFNGRYPSQPT